MAKAMQVAGLTVPAGSAVRHTIEVAELADGTTLTLPLWLIHGAADGPRLVARCWAGLLAHKQNAGAWPGSLQHWFDAQLALRRVTPRPSSVPRRDRPGGRRAGAGA